ncbi:MAG TPA: hypothetical protein VHQ65_16435, partial [Thermoanaerobaculia bacterium]|nr:hypothetical protein [Thermoanaerobaculia bacterium]
RGRGTSLHSVAPTCQPPAWSPPGGGWQVGATLCSEVPRPRLFYLRVATLAVSPNADARYTAPVLETLEDRTYGLASDDPINGEAARRSRRRILQTTVDLRNL